MSGSEVRQSSFTVLIVCTGNICRSALAERLGRAFLDGALGDDADAVRIVSAGTRAVVDSGMHPDSALVLRGLGGDPEPFGARQLEERFVTDADLTLTMTREHRNAVLGLAPRALSRTFTLREAAALLDLVVDDGPPTGEGLAERARQLVRAMAQARSRRHGGSDDDIRDPIGQPVEVHQEVGETIAESLLPVLRRLADLPLRDPLQRMGPVGQDRPRPAGHSGASPPS